MKNFRRERWEKLADAIGVVPDGEEYARLEAAYGEPHRSYHTARHVDECLERLDEAAAAGVAASPWVELALWYHDAVYRPRRSDNERRSADRAEAFLGRHGVDVERRALVRALVLATRHAAPPAGPLEALVVDVDLAILGSGEERFAEYERQIREEYAWVPGFLYRRKRRRVLEGFHERPRIFTTEHFHACLEERARSNLARAIARLGRRRPGRQR